MGLIEFGQGSDSERCEPCDRSAECDRCFDAGRGDGGCRLRGSPSAGLRSLREPYTGRAVGPAHAVEGAAETYWRHDVGRVVPGRDVPQHVGQGMRPLPWQGVHAGEPRSGRAGQREQDVQGAVARLHREHLRQGGVLLPVPDLQEVPLLVLGCSREALLDGTSRRCRHGWVAYSSPGVHQRRTSLVCDDVGHRKRSGRLHSRRDQGVAGKFHLRQAHQD
mmetsp:Transcript_163207/g.523484  ORF Transcript_163207/g.523484 Transcript_163207/m.523484 type:complete len:220 (-) Transcript_163207:3063-3722(-)